MSPQRTRMLAALLAVVVAGGCSVDPDGDDPPRNRAPVIHLVSADPDTAATGATVAVQVTASDPDGDDLAYAWTAAAGLFLAGADSPAAVWQVPVAAGQETLRVAVDDGQASASGAVVVTVREAAPQLGALPSTLRLNLARTTADLALVNIGFGPLHWTATTNAAWLSVQPAAGTVALTDTLAVLVDRSGLAAGKHYGRVSIASDGGNAAITVEIRVADEPVYTYQVTGRYPHDPAAFTQGLLYHDGDLYESTGRLGQSSLRRVALATGEVLQRLDLGPNVFGEGLALWDTTLVQLTWQNQVAYRWGLAGFAPLGSFSYTGQGWGLTADGARFVMSDGSATLAFRDPHSFAVLGHVPVADSLGDVRWLNELEWVDGEVWANVWYTDDIVRIDPATGQVVGWIDLSGLLTPAEAQAADVLNGIAWDPAGGRVFVTGKDWPWLFAIEVLAVE